MTSALDGGSETKRPVTKRSTTIGVKGALVAASLAATLGGWGVLGSGQRGDEPAVSETTPTARECRDETGNAPLCPPVPTLVPASAPVASSGAVTREAAPELAPIPALSVPVAQQPITRTRSSR